jgi:hypothetical protein
MPQRFSQTPVVQFNKGLITEAGELTFPEGASVDELNMTLERTGSRRRRLGVSYEGGYQLPAGTDIASGTTTSVNIWENAGAVAGLNLVVVQLGTILHFFTEGVGALSANKKSFTVNLAKHARPRGFGPSTVPIQVTSIQGILIVASSECDTFKIEYDEDTDTISSERLTFRIRDFEWQGDRSEYDEAEVAASANRQYDTKNAGWKGTNGFDALLTYISGTGTYPALTLPWYAGRDKDGNFALDDFEKPFTGTSLIANGSYTYDVYEMDRSSASGISGVTNYVETTRFKTVVSYGGRVFYSGMSNKNTSNIFFSRLVQQADDLGECLQSNDPTSEDISDLLDTDGGVINIPDAYNIRKLHVLGSQLIVFAENGVWSIKGIDDVFRATGYSINKIGDAGLEYDRSFVAEDGGRPYWWSASGIHTLSVSVEQQTLTVNNVSLSTIQAFFDGISAGKRAQVKAAYDSFNKRVGWFFPKNEETVNGKLSRVLWLDETIPAFYPWEIAEGASGQYLLDPFFVSGNATTNVEFRVVDSSGDQVVDSSGNEVVVTRSGREFTSSALLNLARDASGKVTFANFTDSSFLDWGASSYSSFVEGSYSFMGDLSTKKNILYLTTFCEVTEEAVSGDDIFGYEFIRPSSCLVSTYWDFGRASSVTPQEAYRLKRLPVPDSAGAFLYPEKVTTSRLRLRGRGRSLRFRFESSAGKDFHLLGYDMIGGKNPRI